MKTLTILLLLWSSADSVAHQSTPIREDQIEGMYSQSWELTESGDYSKALGLAKQAFQASKDRNYDKGIVKGNAVLGVIYSLSENDTTAVRHLLEVSQRDLSEHLGTYYFDYCLAFGESLFGIGSFDRGSVYFLRAVEIAEQREKPHLAISTYLKIGSNYSKRGFYNQGISFFQKAYDLSLQHQIETYLPDVLRYLGMSYNRLGDFDQAETFIRQSLNYYQENDDLVKIGDAYLALAGVQAFANENDSSHQNYHKAKHYYEQANNKLGLVYTGLNLSDYFHELNQSDSAEYYLRMAELNNKGEASSARLQAHIYMKQIDAFNQSGRHKDALKRAEEVIKLGATTGDLEVQRQGHFSRSAINEQAKDYNQALKDFKQYSYLSDSLFNDETNTKFSKQKIEIETLAKEIEIQRLAQESALKGTVNASLIVGTILLALVALSIYLYYRSENRRKKVALKNSELQKQNLQQKIQFDQQELSNHTLSMILKNNFLTELEGRLDDLKTANGSTIREINMMIKDIQLNRQAGKDWEKFQTYFGKAHPNFYKSIKERYPELTSSDLRQCALLKMNLSLKESAEILGVDHNSVKMARYRMKKKIGLAEKETLHSAIIAI